jgi:uncharacterized protein YcnI
MRAAQLWLGLCALLAAVFGAAPSALAHVIVSPAESPPGTTQLYTLAVPTETASNNIRVEVQFPRNLAVLQLQAPSGWSVTPETDAPGHIVGAVWNGGSVPSNEFVEVGVLAQNPPSDADLAWSIIQTYADGTETQWIGPETSQFPATVTRVRTPASNVWIAELVAAVAVVVACVSLGFAVYFWWKLRASADARQRRTGWHGAGVTEHGKTA